jgi:glycosyltransferase involved in cell wall biosynthesis
MADAPLRILGIGDAKSLNFLRWAQRLARRGHDVHTVSDRMPPSAALAEGLTVHRLQELEPLLRVPFVRRARIVPAIARLAREIEADVIHAHYLQPYGYWAAESGFRPLVVSPWARDVMTEIEHERGRRLARIALEGADLIVTNSLAIEQAALAVAGDPAKVRRIVWHAEIDGFTPAAADRAGLRATLGWPKDALVVLSLRNFRPYSNLDVLIRAFARVAREEPQARLVLAARGGWTRSEIEALVQELGLTDVVAFHRVEHDQLPALIASADFAVTIQSTDSAPPSLLECMASGLPVVAGYAPSIDEWVQQDEGAEMIECRDEDAVTAAIFRLVRDPELRRRYGERNERVVHELFGDPTAELEAAYREVIGASGPSA